MQQYLAALRATVTLRCLDWSVTTEPRRIFEQAYKYCLASDSDKNTVGCPNRYP